MIKLLATLGICTAGIGSVFGLRAAVGGPQATSSSASPQVSQGNAVGGDSEAVLQVRGLSVLPVPLELSTHLGLPEGVGFLVQSVDPASQAQAAGLEELDVVLSIDDEPADADRLSVLGETDRGLALRIVRAGVVQDIALGAVEEGATASSDSFLSWQALPPDHPFRRLAQLQSLRSDYSTRAEQYSQRVRQVDNETRELREQAEGAQQELLEACQEQIAAYLESRRTELLAQVDQGLAPALAAPLAGLRMDLNELLPQQRLEAVDAQLAELIESLGSEFGQAVPITGVEAGSEAEKRARQRLARIGGGHAKRLHERVQRAWNEGKDKIAREQERLGPQHDERAEWSLEAVTSIRDEVRERVACAIDRSREELSNKLARRLAQHDVPAPGEIEACLEDISLQLEDYTLRFIRRCGEALDSYHREVEGVRPLPTARAAVPWSFGRRGCEIRARGARDRDARTDSQFGALARRWLARARASQRARGRVGNSSLASRQPGPRRHASRHHGLA